MISYKIRYKSFLFYRTITVIGHRYDEVQDKLILYMPDSGIKEIPRWSKKHVKFGPDLMLAIKKKAESEIGQTIPFNGNL